MSQVPVMVCACGKRLRAPGAVPGRVGRCPACGGELRVPEPEPTHHADDLGDEFAAGPLASSPVNSQKPRRLKKRKLSPALETDIWDGLIKPPKRLETRVRDSLLYPLRGSTGVALLVMLPPALWLATLPILTAVTAWGGGESPFAFGSLFLVLPALPIVGVLIGFTLLYLGRVVATSAIGELHHPRWPDWELSSIVFGLGRWLWAAVCGGVIGGFPTLVYWMYCGDVDLFDTMILIELVAVGAAYAQMALLASILHEDAFAANPGTVLRAIVTVGKGYVVPCLLAGAAGFGVATLFMISAEVQSPPLAAFLYWFAWVAALYAAMVVLRVLGLFYHRHAAALGWFRGRTRWGV